MLLLLVALTLGFAQSCKAQELTAVDSLYRQAADNILGEYFPENADRIIYSIGTGIHLVIEDGQNSYHHYVIYSGFMDMNGIVDTIVVGKPNAALDEAFKRCGYLKGFTTLASEFFKDGYEGTLTFNSSFYFVLIDKEGDRYGEARLPIAINPNPTPTEVYFYVYSTLVGSVNKIR